MKPNLIFVQPSQSDIDTEIEKFCERFCDSHYVYLVRPHSEFRDDTPGGMRFLGNPLDQLPGFAEVDAAIAIADPMAAQRISNVYPDAKLAIWDPADEARLPDLLVDLLRPTVIQGNFGSAEQRIFDRAM